LLLHVTAFPCVSGKIVTVDTVLILGGVVQMVASDISKYRIEII
jgi:hypothetical protein